jgi:hypothetical protein
LLWPWEDTKHMYFETSTPSAVKSRCFMSSPSFPFFSQFFLELFFEHIIQPAILFFYPQKILFFIYKNQYRKKRKGQKSGGNNQN